MSKSTADNIFIILEEQIERLAVKSKIGALSDEEIFRLKNLTEIFTTVSGAKMKKRTPYFAKYAEEKDLEKYAETEEGTS